jgi:hypothetical protein
MLAQNWKSFRCSSIHIRDEQLTFRKQKYSQTTFKKFSLYLTGNTFHLHYKEQPVYAV